jgi:aconitate hydratase
MPQNVVEKILSAHRVSGDLTPGGELALRIDQTLTQDATGTMAYLQFESMGLDRVRADLAVSYVDHNTIQVGFENADDHAYLKSVARRYGVIFSRPGNGICHQLHLERFGRPGATLLGSDSHTPTGGGIGMLAIGAGGIDVAVAMGGGPFYLTAPRVTLVHLTGALNPGVSAKDVILKVLSVYGTSGNVGRVLEYGGPGVAALGVPARSTITNMGAELGVTTSLFPSDETTRRFLKAQGRESQWCELMADDGARYDQRLEVDLSAIEPLAACPHSPGSIATVASLSGRRVDQVLIGSCTNSSYRDLKTVALMLRGRKVHPGVEAGVAPGSRQVVEMLAREGLLADLVSAGVRILENACGFCIGNHMSPGSGAVSLRTSNRNFEGRTGTQSAQAYLVSPESAAAAALTGEFTDPRTVDSLPDAVADPEEFLIDDSMFLFRDTAGSGIPDTEIVRGPNIGEVPAGRPLVGALDGVAVIKVGDRITTDHIMPAGARLKYRSNVPRYARCVFENVDPEFYARAAANRDGALHNVIVAGLSYGQGSSREHAAMCPMYLGVKAVIAKSIERIHCANLINFGIVPFLFEDEASYDRIEQGDRLAIDNLQEAVRGAGRGIVRNVTRGTEFAVTAELSERQRTILMCGGLLAAVAGGALK